MAAEAPVVRLRFRSEHKLLASKDFAAVLASGRSVRGNWFRLHYHDANARGARLGLIIGKRNARRATQRNLIKRVAREAFRHARPTLPGYDLVLRLSRSVNDCQEPRARLLWREEIDRLLTGLPR